MLDVTLRMLIDDLTDEAGNASGATEDDLALLRRGLVAEPSCAAG